MRNALPVPGGSARGAHGGAHAVEREGGAADATTSDAAYIEARLSASANKCTGQYQVR
jgi:hypothetical protein